MAENVRARDLVEDVRRRLRNHVRSTAELNRDIQELFDKAGNYWRATCYRVDNAWSEFVKRERQWARWVEELDEANEGRKI